MNSGITEQQEQLIDDIQEWIISGVSRGDVRKKLMDDQKINQQDADLLIEESMTRIAENVLQDPKVVIADHIKKYEEIFAYFKKVGYVQGMNKALKAKEKLLGILKNQNKLVVNNSKNIVVEKKVE